MSTIDQNTLDPELIGKLPVDRSKPFNGLTEEQVRAFGRDPEEVENSRLEQNAFAAAKALNEDATLVLAAQQAVDEFELTPAEAALGLAESGHSRAHDLFLEQWQKAEAEEAAEELAWNATELDAESYAAQHTARKALERTELERERDDVKRDLDAARIEALRDQVDSFVAATPGAHAIKADIEQRIIERVKSTGSLPSTDAERVALVESALSEFQVVGTATEELTQQVNQEWRILRKERGARDGLTSAADIAAAEQHYKQVRFDQLAAETEIDVASLQPGANADEQSSALTAKFREKQERSTAFHQQNADIEERGRFAKERADRGEGISEEKRRYKDAYAKAEAEAQYGEVRTSVGAEETPTRSGALDEYGDAFGRPV